MTMALIHLADAPIVIADLIALTSAAVPDLRETRRYWFPDGWSRPVKVSNQEDARRAQTLLFCRLVDSGEMRPRSPLTWVEADCFRPDEVGRYSITFEEARTFCRHLLIDLQPIVQKTQEERDADVLAQFRRLGGVIEAGGALGGKGALSALAKEDGRARQTLTPILRRAADREGGKAGAIGSMASGLTKR